MREIAFFVVIVSFIEQFMNMYKLNLRGNIHLLDSIGDEITEMVVPSTITEVPACAFLNCVSLTSIVIHESVVTMESFAFQNCSSATINCVVSSQSNGWNEYWNPNDRPVVWGYQLP